MCISKTIIVEQKYDLGGQKELLMLMSERGFSEVRACGHVVLDATSGKCPLLPSERNRGIKESLKRNKIKVLNFLIQSERERTGPRESDLKLNQPLTPRH